MTTPAAATLVGGATAPAGGDGFDSILGGVMLGNDMAKIAAPPAQSVLDASSAPATDCAARPTQSLLPLQEDDPALQDSNPAAGQSTACDGDSAETTAGGSIDTLLQGAVPAGVSSPAAQADCVAASTHASNDPDATLTGLAPGNAVLPAKTLCDPDAAPPPSSGGDASAKLSKNSCDAAAIDPALAQLLAGQQPMPATLAAAPATASRTDPVLQAADPAPASDATAAAIIAAGATTKPGKPGMPDFKAPADSEKTQTLGSMAAALADSAAARVFTDQQVSSAHALPLHIVSDGAKDNGGNGQSGGSPTDQQNNPAAAPNPMPVADAAAVHAAPVHAPVQALPQPDMAGAASAATVPVAAPATTSPAQAATQLQISNPASPQPDINMLAFNIATKSEGGARHFDIRLDPAELGRVDVRLTVDDAGKAQATLSVEKPQTLELLQKDQSHLERALKDAGLDLSQNGLNFSLKGQQQQSGGNAPTARGRNLAVRAIAAADAAATNLSLGGVASDTRLDIRV